MEYCEKHHLERAGARELRAIEAELHRRSNNHHNKSCLSYIAGVLRETGKKVDYKERKSSRGHSSEDHHEERLKGLLKLSDLDSAFASLQEIDAIYRENREVSDRLGTSLVRELVAGGEQRAKSMAANARLTVEKRREKEEIAKWFKVWLEVPDLFFDWVEMRQKSEEFEKLFPRSNGHSRHHAGQ